MLHHRRAVCPSAYQRFCISTLWHRFAFHPNKWKLKTKNWKLSPNKIFSNTWKTICPTIQNKRKKIIKNNLLSNLGHITKRIIFFPLSDGTNFVCVCVSSNGVTFRVCENLFQEEKIVRIKCRFCENFKWNFPFLIFYFVIEVFSKFFFRLFLCDEINDRNDAQFHLVRVWFNFRHFCNKIFEDFRQEVEKN